MKLRMLAAAVALASLAATAVADLPPEFIDWTHGPASHLLTKEEAAKMATIQTADEARAFVALFWARRDPTPDTPRNEYREQVEGLIRYANENFNREKVPGSMTDRGRTLILFGPPKRVERAAADQGANIDVHADLQRDQRTPEAVQRWIYEGDDAKAVFGSRRAEIRFLDKNGNQDTFTLEPSRLDLTKARDRAIERTIKQAALTVAPVFQTAAPAPQAPPPPPPVVTELTTDALKTAVTEFKAAAKNPYEGKAAAAWGEYVTAYGETYAPVGLYVPKAAGVSGDVTFFGVVEDASGKSVLAFEQPATLLATKDDFFVDKTVKLPAGKHRGIFGIAQNGKVVAMAAADMELAGALDKDASAVTPLILSNNVYPLTEAQKPDDPFAFGGVKVIPKADHTFRPTDELWYFFEMRNPGIAETPLPEGTVPVNPAEVQGMPKVQLKLDVEGTDTTGKKVKMSAPPRETEAIAMKGVPGHYGVGNAIPLATFKPGDYTFTVKVIDTIKKTSYTLTDKFKVVE